MRRSRLSRTGAALWFRRKSNGRGFTPRGWPGWLGTLIFLTAEMATARLPSRGARWPLLTLGAAEPATYFLLASCSGGSTIWNWFTDFDGRSDEL